MQVIVPTSEGYYHCLPPFIYLWDKYCGWNDVDMAVCGFETPDIDLHNDQWWFHSLGYQVHYPASIWSDKLLRILDEVADDQFILMLEDYWITRPADMVAIRMLYDYARQFENVLKIDLTHDRLYINGGGNFLFGYNTYDNCGYLDLIKSPPGTPYQMSLWGGIWNRDQLRRVLVSGETAQEIEIAGTRRVTDDQLVLGTRQAPLLHGNIYQSRNEGKPLYQDGGWGIKPDDLEYMKNKGWLKDEL